MITRVVLATVCSFVCGTVAAADVIQDAGDCGQLKSARMSCAYVPPLSWPASHQGDLPSFFWQASRENVNSLSWSAPTRIAVDPSFAVLDFEGSPVGTLAADATRALSFELPGIPNASSAQDFNPVFSWMASATTDRVDQPVEFVFAMGLGDSGASKTAFDLETVDPKFHWPWKKSDVPEPAAWSELLSIALGGMVMAGIFGLGNRRIPR